MAIEIFQMYKNKLSYLADPWNYVNLATYIMTLTVLFSHVNATIALD